MKRWMIWLVALCLLLPCGATGMEFLVTEDIEEPSAALLWPDEPAPADADAATEAQYQEARELLAEDAFADAANIFGKLGSYRSSQQFYAYAKARLSYQRQDLAGAQAAFEALGDFADASERVELCRAMALHRCCAQGKFGYAGPDGSIVIEPAYDWAERTFREDGTLLPVAVVFVGETAVQNSDVQPVQGKYGLLRRDGVLVVPVAYDEVLWTCDGIAAVRSGREYTLIDLTTGDRLGDVYSGVGAWSEDAVPVRRDGKWGYLTRDEEMLYHDFAWDEAQPFCEGLAIVRKDGLYGYVNCYGYPVIAPAYRDARPFGAGLAAVKEGREWGFINENGEMVIEPQYADAGRFFEDVCAAKHKNAWGLIDRSGAWVVNAQYSEFAEFDALTRRAWFRLNKLWGLVTPEGTMVLEPSWARYSDFGHETMALVRYEDAWACIDAMGSVRISMEDSAASPVRNGRCGMVTGEGEVTYFDRMMRGFTVESDVPTETLCGFIEGRRTVSTDEGSMAEYRLYDAQGNVLMDWSR